MKWSSAMVLAIGLIVGFSFGLMLAPLIATQNDVNVAMWLEVVHQVCTSVGGLGTFVALIVVVRQFYLLRIQSVIPIRKRAPVVSVGGAPPEVFSFLRIFPLRISKTVSFTVSFDSGTALGHSRGYRACRRSVVFSGRRGE
jgi:hypothetical protein